MVDRGCGLPLSRQCELLRVSRSSQYYESLGESAENLALMRRLEVWCADITYIPVSRGFFLPDGRHGLG